MVPFSNIVEGSVVKRRGPYLCTFKYSDNENNIQTLRFVVSGLAVSYQEMLVLVKRIEEEQPDLKISILWTWMLYRKKNQK